MNGQTSFSSAGRLSRRRLLRWAGAGLLGTSASGWLSVLADELAGNPNRKRYCILLWMSGGPSQTDTFDMKPDHANGGDFKEIATNVPGLRISEHLPKLAQQGNQLAVIRSVSTTEGDHGRGTFLMRTGHRPGGPDQYPTIGSLLSKELGDEEAELPNYVSIAPVQAFNQTAQGPGFLGPKYAAATVSAIQGDPSQAPAGPDQDDFARLGVDHLRLPAGVQKGQADGRLALWRSLQSEFLANRSAGSSLAQDTVYRRAIRTMRSEASVAFDLSHEADDVRRRYGRGRFGQGCLIARRLVERGVPFVEVTLGGFQGGISNWDTHQNNFQVVKNLSAELDAGWAALMSDLRERGLLETTTILWMGEFGRTPTVNDNAGRDHFPNAWSCVLAGGGVNGGQAYGRTSPDGTTIQEGKVEVGDLLATLCAALGVDPEKQNISDIGRPISIADGDPITEMLA